MTFRKFKRRLVVFFTGENRRARLKAEIREELTAGLKREMSREFRQQLKQERAKWNKREKERRKPKGVITGLEGNTLHQENGSSFTGKIAFSRRGQGNAVRFAEGSHFSGKLKVGGHGNVVEFGPHTRIRGTLAVGGEGVRLVFGDYTTTVDIFLVAGWQDILIGKWCMISRRVEIRSNDSHSVVERESGVTLNTPEPVIVGDHVWICAGVHVNKGSRIPSDCIVAAMSFVNRAFEETGVILGGIPAKIIRRGITWNRKMLEKFSARQLDYRIYNQRGEEI